MLRRLAIAPLAAVALAVPGCGGDGGDGGGERKPLVVSAAASLKEALSDCSPRFAGAPVRLSFGGSDELAAQIRKGGKPDLYAAADSRLPQQLARENRVERPRVFAGNELVIAVRRDSEVKTLDDLAVPGRKIAMGSESVPVGAYAREVLSRIEAAKREAILGNVRSNEPDVKGVVGKLTQGAVDAGFVYSSDVLATGGELRAIPLAPELKPRIAYSAAVVRDAKNAEAARRYLDEMIAGGCQDALLDAGFAPPRGG